MVVGVSGSQRNSHKKSPIDITNFVHKRKCNACGALINGLEYNLGKKIVHGEAESFESHLLPKLHSIYVINRTTAQLNN